MTRTYEGEGMLDKGLGGILTNMKTSVPLGI